MPRWKALSAELDPPARELVVQLRRLKDRGGLSLRQLAAKTGYSAKSWERYLGGAALPPGEAVEALARIGGGDPVRLLALREVAGSPSGARPGTGVRAPEGESARGPVAAPGAGEPGDPVARNAESAAHRRLLRVAVVTGTAALVVAVSCAVFVALRLDGRDEAPVASVTTPGTASSAPAYTCRIERDGDLWYAGISRTQDENLGYGAAGPEVAEAQCLLRRAGISPGGIDGMFGPLTQRAVKAFQKRAGLDVDGMVGPHTWKALRG